MIRCAVVFFFFLKMGLKARVDKRAIVCAVAEAGIKPRTSHFRVRKGELAGHGN